MTVYISVIASFAALVSWLVMSSESMIRFVRENGPIENLTLVVYVVAIGLILYSGRTVLKVQTRVAIVILLAYMFMREAGFHKSLSGTSILKIKFWLGSQFPVADKLMALAILIPVLWMLFYFIRGYTRRWWSDLCVKDGYAVGIFVFLAVLVVSKIFDRSLNMMTEMWGWHFPVWVETLVTGQEEYLECILPLLITVSFYQYREVHKTVMMIQPSPFISVYIALLTSLTALACWCALPPADMLAFAEEGGMVERMTLICYVAAILFVIFSGHRIKGTTKCAVVIMLAYMCMREMDLHKSVSSESILKSRFWLGNHIPVTDKLLAILILLPIVWMLVHFIRNHAGTFFRELRNKEGHAITILVFFVVLAVSKCIDRSLNVLTELYGMHFTDCLVALQLSQEEFLECLLPVLIIVASWQYMQRRKWLTGF